MNSVFGYLGGRKFLLAVFGVISIALHSALGVPESAITTIGGIVAAYIFGQGVADRLSAGETSTSAKFIRRRALGE